MNQPFSITCGEVDVEMGGNTVLLDKNNKPIDQPGEVFEFWKCELQVSHHENYVVLTGSPRTDVTVSVTKHLFRDGKMGSVDPFSEKNGIRKYSSRNDLYVVFQRTDGERRVYVICHRQYPTGRVIWDTGSRKRLPTELTDAKPLVQHMDLGKSNGHGEQPQITDLDDIAGSQLKPDNGKRKRRAEARVS